MADAILESDIEKSPSAPVIDGKEGISRTETYVTLVDNAQPGQRSSSRPGSGTPDDPYIVDWDAPYDPENPKDWSNLRKWLFTYQLAMGTLCVSFCSSSYSGGVQYMMKDLKMSEEVAALGISVYVLGFALGPLIWAPLGETFGRRMIFLFTYTPFTLFHLGGALAHNTTTLLITRFFAGALGSSPLSNAGGAIQDIWDVKERGVAQALYAMAPFTGPVLGPIVGGYVSQTRNLGWRFNFWLMFIFSGINLVIGFLNMPETFAPLLLRRRANLLQTESNGLMHYMSKFDKGRSLSFAHVMRVNLSRPFLFLAQEPIVALLSIYSALTYSTLYAFFSAFPIVFQKNRGFSPGEGGLAFLGIGLGIVVGGALTPVQNMLYRRAVAKSHDGVARPESRLILACVAAILLPVGMFWFAWTTSPSIHWIVPIIAGVPFGAGMILLFVAITGYLIDTYTIYCASALAANILLRSILAAAFPVFTPKMFAALGTEWGSTVFAFLTLVCLPMPFLFFVYGPRIRARSRFASQMAMEATEHVPHNS